MKSFKTISILLIIVLFIGVSAKAQKKPKLVVGIVVDQMRYDYLERFAKNFGDDGFKRLMREGSNFTFAHYNYVPTYTAPGHASIYTGSTPYYHGIIGNDWHDKYSNEYINSVKDTNYYTVGSNSEEGARSPKKLLAATITDQLKIETGGNSKVISISFKDRASILPGGHMPDAAYWYDDKNGKFITSSYYMKSLPDWVRNFNDQKYVNKYLSSAWNLSLPISEYKVSTPDDVDYEKDVFKEGKKTFPHQFNNLPLKDKYELFKDTPFGNQFLFDFVKEAVKNEKLGQHSFADFLAVSFSSTDYIGHDFGPNSVEVEDTYIKLDKLIGEFLKFLDESVGKGNYLLFLTADHGAAEARSYLKKHNLPTGSLGWHRTRDSLYAYASRAYGSEKLIESFSNLQVYLNYDFMEEKNLKSSHVTKSIANYLKKNFGNEVQKVFLRDDLLKEVPKRDNNKFILNGYSPIRSGDIAIQLPPGYFTASHYETNDVTTHGTSYSYDTHVPLLFYGWHVPSAKINEPVYIVDIAATIANILGIDEPEACYGIPLIK